MYAGAWVCAYTYTQITCMAGDAMHGTLVNTDHYFFEHEFYLFEHDFYFLNTNCTN